MLETRYTYQQLDIFKKGNEEENKKKRIDVLSARSGTFTDNIKLPVHRWFKYSAGFSAEWAEQLIIKQSKSKQIVVLDPFAGSGTTLISADKVGATAYGYESHPFVHRIASSKLLWYLDENEFLELANTVIDAAKKLFVTNNLPEKVPALLLKCYTTDTLLGLFSLRDAFNNLSRFATEQERPVYDLVWLTITAILRPCSYVGTAQWQYILPNKRKATTLDPFEAYKAKVSEISLDMLFAKRTGFSSFSTMYSHDAREPGPIKKSSVDLVLTSPPYPNNYDYADATRLEMTFWGEISSWGDLQYAVRRFIIRSSSQHSAAEGLQLDQLLADKSVSPIVSELSVVCNELAEVRLTKGGKKAYHTMVAAYFCDLSKVFIELRHICKTGATVCFVIGDSAPYGVYVPADDWLGHLAVAAGFKSFYFEKLRDRNIKWKNRKHRVPLHEGRLWIEG